MRQLLISKINKIKEVHLGFRDTTFGSLKLNLSDNDTKWDGIVPFKWNEDGCSFYYTGKFSFSSVDYTKFDDASLLIFYTFIAGRSPIGLRIAMSSEET